VSWITRRLDHLGSAGFGGAGGIGFSQAPAFTQAYLQRLGGHIDEASLTIRRLAEGEMLPWLGTAEREMAVAELSLRLSHLEQLRQSLVEAPGLLRPAVLLQHADWTIARRAWEDFVPAIPLDPASLLWTGIGIVLAVITYELLGLPLWARRRFRQTPDKPARQPNRRAPAITTAPKSGRSSPPRPD